jgi:hypothetical protein
MYPSIGDVSLNRIPSVMENAAMAVAAAVNSGAAIQNQDKKTPLVAVVIRYGRLSNA